MFLEIFVRFSDDGEHKLLNDDEFERTNRSLQETLVNHVKIVSRLTGLMPISFTQKGFLTARNIPMFSRKHVT